MLLFLPLVPFLFSPDADTVIENAIAARERVRTGIVVLYRERFTGQPDGMDAIAQFDESHFRIDVQQFHQHIPLRLPSGQFVDPFRIVCDGKHAMSSFAQPAKAGVVLTFELSPEDQSAIPLFNARALGLPAHPGSDVDIRACFRTDLPNKSARLVNGAYVVILSGARAAEAPSQLMLTIDPTRGWSVTEYVLEVTAPGGTDYIVKGWSRPERFGDVWYPTWWREEQCRGTSMDWSREYLVSGVELNKQLDPAAFTWQGIGAKHGSLIGSKVVDVPSHRLSRPAPSSSSEARQSK